MSWLNLNQSLNQLKGQITNFATEVLSDGVVQENNVTVTEIEEATLRLSELGDKCQAQQVEIESLKRLNEQLQRTLQQQQQLSVCPGHVVLAGYRDPPSTPQKSQNDGDTAAREELSWHWEPPAPQAPDPAPCPSAPHDSQLQRLQDEISKLKAIIDEDEIGRLKKENASLTSSLEDLDSQHQAAMDKLIDLKTELQANFEILKRDYEQLKSSNSSYSAQVKELQAKLTEKQKLIEQSQSNYDTLHHKYYTLERIHSLLKENAENFQEENQELHEEIFKLQEELAKRHDEMDGSSEKISKTKYDDLLKEIAELRNNRRSIAVHLDETNIDDNAKSVIENLKRDITDLKTKLSQSETHSVSNVKLMQLYNKYVNFDLPVDYVGEIPCAGDNHVLFKIENALRTLHNFRIEIQYLEHDVSERKLNQNHLQTQIDDMTAENEYMTTELQQVEHELSEMKKNNDFLISEIAALKNQPKLEPIIETHEDNIAKLENELEHCNDINKSFENEIAKINIELSEVKNEKDLLHSDLSDLRAKYTEMLQELETYKTNSSDLECLDAEIGQEQADKMQKSLDEIDLLKSKLRKAAATNEQLNIDTQLLENDKVLIIKELEDTKVLLDDKDSELKKISEVNSCMEIALNNLEKKLDCLSDTETANTKHYDILVQKLKILAESDYSSWEESEMFKNIDNESDNHIAILINKMSDYIKNEKILNARIEELRETTHQLENNVFKFTEKKSETDHKISELTQELITLKDNEALYLKEIAELKSKISSNEDELLRSEILELRSKCIIQDEQIKSLRDMEIERDELIFVKTQIENELDRTSANLSICEKQFNDISNDLQCRNNDLKVANEKLMSLDNDMQTLQGELETKDKIINDLSLNLDKVAQNYDALESSAHDDEVMSRLNEERQQLLAERDSLRERYENTLKELQESFLKANELSATLAEKEALVKTLSDEKAELINLINIKHNESIQYHAEIQRLNELILNERNQFEMKLNEVRNETRTNCDECERLKQSLIEKDDALSKVAQRRDELQATSERERECRTLDTVHALTEKCEELDNSLTIQLELVKTLREENQQLSEALEGGRRECGRLRAHLAELEAAHTAELVAAEARATQLGAQLAAAEQRAQHAAASYTSSSVRAQQQLDTLRAQLALATRQRDQDATARHQHEEELERAQAANTNLAAALDLFQREKEREIEEAVGRVRAQLEERARELQEARAQLGEARAGLHAARRLADQLAHHQTTIAALNAQVSELQRAAAEAGALQQAAAAHSQDRVDKGLLKNLLLNLLHARTHTDRVQVVRVLSTVLDFNAEECARAGLSRPRPPGPATGAAHPTLASQFVHFLEQESRPAAVLPSMLSLGQLPPGSPAPASAASSRAHTPTLAGGEASSSSHRRTSSSGSGNLLLAAWCEPQAGAALHTGVSTARSSEGAILRAVLRGPDDQGPHTAAPP